MDGRPFYPLLRNNMTQDMVKDNRESPVKQQTRILNRLGNLRAAFCKYRPLVNKSSKFDFTHFWLINNP